MSAQGFAELSEIIGLQVAAQSAGGAPASGGGEGSMVFSLLGALVITLNPLNPFGWVTYFITSLVMSLSVLPKKNGKSQWKKGALYALPVYMVIMMPLNFVLAKTSYLR